MHTVFKSDQEFFQWMDENPNGYILNHKNPNGKAVFFLHKPHCKHLIRTPNFSETSYTSGDIKVGGNSIADIMKYCIQVEDKFEDFQVCKSCHPVYVKGIIYPDELQLDVEEVLMEGVKKQVIVNSYERNSKARAQCLKYFGTHCQCCGFDFEKIYGEIGKDFIHVHHLKMISEIGESYVVDPIKDLIPLCPNCHAMIHKRNPPYSIEEMKSLLNR